MNELIIGGLAVFAGSLVQGAAAFAFALVSLPFLFMILPPVTIVPMMVIVSFLNNVPMIIECRRHIDRRIVGPLLAGAIAGIPLGMFILKNAPEAAMKIVAGSVTAVVGLLLLSGWTLPIRNQTAGTVIAGFASGILQGGIAVPGPPVVLFLANQAASKEFFRASLVGYFACLNIASMIIFTMGGLYTREVIRFGITFTPFALTGVMVGIWLSRIIPQELFRRLVLILVTVMGGVLVLTQVI